MRDWAGGLQNTSHYWARELIALGHDVRLMPAQYVKPYVGFANYATVLADPLFLASLSTTLLHTALAVATNLASALAFATLLDSPLVRRARSSSGSRCSCWW